MTNPKPTRTRLKFALGVVVLFAVVGWFVAWPAYQRHRAIAEIERVGGHAIAGMFWFDSVVIVRLDETGIDDEGLTHIGNLTELKFVNLTHTRISDAGLVHLKGMTNLKALFLFDTKVTDAGLEHLKGMTQLRNLYLVNTKVTDDGVKMLQESLPNCRIFR